MVLLSAAVIGESFHVLTILLTYGSMGVQTVLRVLQTWILLDRLGCWEEWNASIVIFYLPKYNQSFLRERKIGKIMKKYLMLTEIRELKQKR